MPTCPPLRPFVPALLCGLFLQQVPAAEISASQARLVPEKAALCLEIHRPELLLNPLLSRDMGQRLREIPGYQQWLATPKSQELQNVVRLVEMAGQTNWQTVAKSLTRGGVTFAVGGGNRHLLSVTGDDPALLQRLHEFALQIARSEADKRGQGDQVRSGEYNGLTGWTFNGAEAHTIIGNRLLAASDAEVLKAAVNLRDSGGVGSLENRESYQQARKAVGTGAVATLFVDLEQMRGGLPFLKGLDPERQNPLAALLFADLPTRLNTARWVALGLYLESEGPCLRLYADGPGEQGGVAAFSRVAADTSGLEPNLEVPRQIAALNVHRDLAGFYAAKDELFPQRTSGLIFFENMMGIFFSGRNLTDEVLAATKPQIQLVVARQKYDLKAGVPEPQLPAFALVLGLRDPEQFGEVMEEAWQKALGLINFTRGQKAQPGLILDRVDHGGTKVTLARFSTADVTADKPSDQRFNFRPSLALAQGHAILSSTDQLACDLVDALGRGSAAAGEAYRGVHSLVQMTGTELATILRSNRVALIRGNMLSEGKSEPEAALTIDGLCALAGWVDRASLKVGRLAPGEAAELQLRFRSP